MGSSPGSTCTTNIRGPGPISDRIDGAPSQAARVHSASLLSQFFKKPKGRLADANWPFFQLSTVHVRLDDQHYNLLVFDAALARLAGLVTNSPTR